MSNVIALPSRQANCMTIERFMESYNSGEFSDVTIVVMRQDGSVDRYEIDPTVRTLVRVPA